MSQLRRGTTTLRRALASRPAAHPLFRGSAENRLFSQNIRLRGKEWRNGASKGYIKKPAGLTEPQWDKLQTMMKMRSLAYEEYFESLFGSSNPLMAKRFWHEWVMSTPNRDMRDDIKAKELEALMNDVQNNTRDLQEYAQAYLDWCVAEDFKELASILGDPKATGRIIDHELRVEGDPVLEADLKGRAIRFVDELLKGVRFDKPEIEPKMAPVSDLIRQSRKRYGTTFKEPDELAEYKKKHADLLAPEKEQPEPEGRVYDPISHRMVPAAAGAVEGPGALEADWLVEGEGKKKKDPKEEGEGGEDKVRSNDMRPYSQHEGITLRIERMIKTLHNWTKRNSRISSGDCPYKHADAIKDSIPRPPLTQFNGETETERSDPGVLRVEKESRGVNLGGVGGWVRGSSENENKKLNNLTRNETSPKATPQTQGSSYCSSSFSVNSAPSAVSSKSAAQIDAVSAGEGAVLADSGSASIPKPIVNYATKIAEISKALDTLSSMHTDQAKSGESTAPVPKPITDFSTKITELKRTLETLGPVLAQSTVESSPADSDAPKPTPAPATRLQSALERIASTPKFNHKIAKSDEQLGRPAAESRSAPESSPHSQSASADDPIPSPLSSDIESESKNEPSPKTSKGNKYIGAPAAPSRSASSTLPHSQSANAEDPVSSPLASDLELQSENEASLKTSKSNEHIGASAAGLRSASTSLPQSQSASVEDPIPSPPSSTRERDSENKPTHTISTSEEQLEPPAADSSSASSTLPHSQSANAEDPVSSPLASDLELQSKNEPSLKTSESNEHIGASAAGLRSASTSLPQSQSTSVEDPIPSPPSSTREHDSENKPTHTISTSEEQLEPPAADSSSASSTLPPSQPANTDDPILPPPPPEIETPPKTVYKVLAYDPGNDILTTSTSTTPPRPGCEEASLCLPRALSMLSNPCKFVPHLPKNFEPVFASANLLVLRETVDIGHVVEDSGRAGKEVETALDGQKEEKRKVNPVDGTTVPFPEVPVGNFASPTGFVNYDNFGVSGESRSSDSGAPAQGKEEWRANERENERSERDRERGEGGRWCGGRHRHSGRRSYGKGDRRPRGGAASVAKTAILGVSACYIAGVVGEVVEPRR